ncbi:MAG: hypothetical protein ACT4NL_01890 [Pseudomarimonas sp.]
MLVLAFALSSAPAFASAVLAPGASLDSVATPSSEHRYSINGAPSGAFGVLPNAPSLPGKHWLVTYGSDQRVLAWTRFEVAGEAADAALQASAARRSIQLRIDAEPPTATITFAGAAITSNAAADIDPESVSHVLGPLASFDIEATDLSGGITTQLLVDGKPLPAGARLQQDRPDGRYHLALRTRDALGNEGERASTHVQLDSTPPTLTWQRLDADDGLPTDVFDGKRARLSVRVSDAGAGVSSLRVGEQAFDQQLIDNAPLELKLGADSLGYELSDRVGNTGSGQIALRADTEGPQLSARLNGEPINLESATITHADTLQLDAEDRLAGVARACVEFSRGIHSCRSLPFQTSGMTPGDYVVEFRAVDRLGNGNVQWLSFEVLP